MNATAARIAAGPLGPWLDAARAADLVAEVAASDIETVRVLFPDPHGVLRGKTLTAEAFAGVFTSGMAVPSTLLLKDTSHRTVFAIWSAEAGAMTGAGDILLVPDPATFRRLPWAPRSAWILCDARARSGAEIAFDSRTLLKGAMTRLAGQGLALVVGLEVEFHVFERLDPRLGHGEATMPGQPPLTRNLTQGYQFLTETAYGVLEPVIDDLRRTCQGLGMPLRSMEVEMGPSQIEFTFDPADPLTHADNMVMLRTAVKETAARQGLHATFMCRPRIENTAASGWHIHQSLVDLASGNSRMIPQADGALTATAAGWIAGLLAHAAESCLLTTPTVNGYKRYRPHQLAPDRIQWGRDNRGAMLRALMTPGDPASRIENRAPDPAANPYYVLGAQILSGLDGLERGLHPPAASETPYDSAAPMLPTTLLAAIEAFDASSFYRATLGDAVVDHLVRIKRAEWDRYMAAVSEWEQAEYFSLF